MKYKSGTGVVAPLSELEAFLSGCLDVEREFAVGLFLQKALLIDRNREGYKTRVVSVSITNGVVTVWTGADLGDETGFTNAMCKAVLVQLAELEAA